MTEQGLNESNKQIASSLTEAVQREREKYAASWKINAAKFLADGNYDWMAQFLDGHSRVLEIGTGDGTSTMVLARKGHEVVGVDENPVSLKEAEGYLLTHGVKVRLVKREHLTTYRGRYQVKYKYPKDVEVHDGVTLLEGDVINDPKLTSWFESVRYFDAITCWCMGTHQARRWQADFDRFEFETPADYRVYVQRQIYLLADKLLRPGGVLQTVNRSEVPRTEHLREDFLATHKRLAQATSLRVQGLEYRVYEEPVEKEGVEMVVTPGLSGRTPDMSELALQSVLATKEA